MSHTPFRVKRHRWPWILLAVVVIVATAGGVTYVSLMNDSQISSAPPESASATALPPAEASAQPSQSRSNGSDANPSATPDSNDPGDGVATDPPQDAPTQAADDGRIQVNVVLTRFGTTTPLDAGGFVNGVVESGGTCTLTATQGGITLTASGPGAPSAQTTDCGEGLEISDSRLATGSWTLTLSYSSERYVGSSQPQSIG